MARPRPTRASALGELSWDFWVLVLALVAVFGYGVFSLFQPAEPNRLPAILGHREVGRGPAK